MPLGTLLTVHPSFDFATMSGAEALVVIGIVASIIQLVDFSSKAVARIKGLSEDVHNVPKAYRDVQSILPLVANTLESVCRQASSGQLSEAKCRMLLPVIRHCESNLKELTAIFKKIFPNDNASRRDRFRKAISSLSKDKEVERIAASIRGSIDVVAAYYVVSGPDANKDAQQTSSINHNAAPPKIHFMVPFQWSDSFTGREVELQKMDEYLCLQGKHCRIALVGLGGIGKTRLALEFARRYKNSTEISVLWVHASSVDRMKKSFLDIARAARIPGWQEPKTDIFELVQDWLEGKRSGRWLLVIDNADDLDFLYEPKGLHLAKYFPRSDNGSILMTTRFQKIGLRFTAPANVIPLSGLAGTDSIAILTSKSHNNTPDPVHDEEYEELANQLEHIPLALVQAAAYMSMNYVSVSEFLRLYRESDTSKIQLLSEDFEDDMRDIDIKNPIITTWTITFNKLRGQDPFAAEVLSLMSILDTNAIPESLLLTDNPVTLKTALGTLRSLSLINLRKSSVKQSDQDPSYDLHRLVRLTTRNWLKMTNTFDWWTAKALKVLATRYPEGRFENREIWIRYLSHAIAVLSVEKLYNRNENDPMPMAFLNTKSKGIHAGDGEFCPICTARLLQKVSESLQIDGSFLTAKQYNESAIYLRKIFLGEHHPYTLDSLDNDAYLSFLLQNYETARTISRQVFDIRRAIQGEKAPETLKSMLHLALSTALSRHNKPVGDISLMTEVVELHCELLGDENPETITAKTWLAGLEVILDFYKGGLTKNQAHSEEIILGIVKLNKRVMGPKHPRTLDSMLFLGFRYIALGRYTEAETTFVFVIESQKERTGYRHPDTLLVMRDLAKEIYLKQGRQDEAESLLIKVIELQSKVLGRENASTISSIDALVEFYEDSSANKEEGFERVVEPLRKHLGDDDSATMAARALLHFYQGDRDESEKILLKDPRSIRFVEVIAAKQHNANRYAEAEGLFLLVLSARQRSDGEINPDTLNSMMILAINLRWQGRILEAVEYLKRVFDIVKSLYGEKDYKTLTALAYLAQVHELGTQHAEAAELRLKLLTDCREQLGKEHPDTLSVMVELAKSYHWLGRLTEAGELELLVVNSRTRLLGEQSPETLTAVSSLAVTYELLKEHDKSAELREKVLKNQRLILGEEDPTTLEAMSSLASSYEWLGKYDASAELRLQVLKSRRLSLGEEDPATLDAMSSLAMPYEWLGRWQEAGTLWSLVFNKRTLQLGAKHPETLQAARHVLKSLLWQKDKYEEGELLERSILAIHTELDGEKGANTLASMVSLANFLYWQKKYTEAAELQRKVLDIDRELLGETHRYSVGAASTLINTLLWEAQYAEAEIVAKQLLEVRESLSQEEHDDTLECMVRLGQIFDYQKKNTEAAQIRGRVYDIRLRTSGARHEDTLEAAQSLVSTFRKARMYQEWQAIGQSMVDAQVHIYGEEHENTLEGMLSLAGAHWNMKQFAEAASLEKRVLNVRMKTLGEGHEKTYAAAVALQSTLFHNKQLAEAEELLQRMLQITSESQGELHKKMAECMTAIGNTRFHQGKFAEAGDSYQSSFDTHVEVFGESHPETLELASAVRATLHRASRLAEAEAFERRFLQILTEVHGEKHEDTLQSLKHLGILCRRQGKYIEATHPQNRLLTLRCEMLGLEHIDTRIAARELLATYWNAGRNMAGERLEEGLLVTLEKMHGRRNFNTLVSMASLGLFCHYQGKYIKAEVYQRRALIQIAVIPNEMHPVHLFLRCDFAMTLLRLGLVKEALFHYGLAIKLATNGSGELRAGVEWRKNRFQNLLKTALEAKATTSHESMEIPLQSTICPNPPQPKRLGWSHGKSNLKVQCATCDQWYMCGLCHDIAEDHRMNRWETQAMLCTLCSYKQPTSQTCVRCNTLTARYYCDICKYWNDDMDKTLYHCNDCGVCYPGLRADFYHCKVCYISNSHYLFNAHHFEGMQEVHSDVSKGHT